MRHLFMAKSPKTGELRKYEGLLELGTPGPYAIVSIDEGDEESYAPGESGYELLLPFYQEAYGDR